MPLNLTCLHCLQHSSFEHHFNLYYFFVGAAYIYIKLPSSREGGSVSSLNLYNIYSNIIDIQKIIFANVAVAEPGSDLRGCADFVMCVL